MKPEPTQPRVTLYNTASLDGFIANSSGEFNWLAEDYSLDLFFARCQRADAIVMGRNAWESYSSNKMTPLGTGNTFVFTSTPILDESVSSVSGRASELVARLGEQGCPDILLVGGTRTNELFLRDDLIDEFVLDIQPVFLGGGLRLFETEQRPMMKLLKTERIGSVLHSHYARLETLV